MPAWEIDTWVMSCRVLGRKVEQASLLQIAEAANQQGVTRLIGRYIPTEKNGMVKDHYEKLGFKLVERDEEQTGETLWSLEIASYLESIVGQPSLPFEFG